MLFYIIEQLVTPAVVNPLCSVVCSNRCGWTMCLKHFNFIYNCNNGGSGVSPPRKFWNFILKMVHCLAFWAMQQQQPEHQFAVLCFEKNVILIFFPDHINSLTFPWLEQIFSIFPDFSLTILKFPDISRFPAFPDKVVTLDKFSYIPHVLVMWRQYCWLLALAKFSTVFLV